MPYSVGRQYVAIALICSMRIFPLDFYSIPSERPKQAGQGRLTSPEDAQWGREDFN